MSKAKKIMKKIGKLYKELSDLKHACDHPADKRTYTLHWDTGNFCKADDCEWTIYTCEECHAVWHQDNQHGLVGRQTNRP